MFALRVLGGATIADRDGPLTGRVGQRRRLALLAVLAMLALGGPTGLSRDRLAAMFWPESDDDRARHSLADAVYQIRRELSEQAIVTRGEEVVLDPTVVTSDVGAFEDAVAGGDLEAAVALGAISGGPRRAEGSNAPRSSGVSTDGGARSITSTPVPRSWCRSDVVKACSPAFVAEYTGVAASGT